MTFNPEKHGYSRSEVDAYISTLEKHCEGLNSEISSLKAQLEEKERQSEELEKKQLYIEDTIVNARILANGIVRRAETDADSMLKEAEEKKKTAEEHIKTSLAELENKRKDCENAIKRIYNIMQSQIAFLENNMEDSDK